MGLPKRRIPWIKFPHAGKCEGGHLFMSNYIVAFLDMLGTTRLIHSESSEEARKKLHFLGHYR